jgi:hypothetical protein
MYEPQRLSGKRPQARAEAAVPFRNIVFGYEQRKPGLTQYDHYPSV